MTTNDIRIMKFMEEKHEEYVNKMKAAAPGSDFSVLVQFQPVTATMVRHDRENGGNVPRCLLMPVHRKQPGYRARARRRDLARIRSRELLFP